MIRKLKFIKQENASDCGVSCLLSIIRMYGGNSSVERLRELTMTNKNGTTAFNLVQALKNLGFDASGYKCDDIKKIDKLPCIAHVIIDNKYLHYVIIKSIDLKANKIIIIDPSIGVVKYNVEDFYKIWTRVVILFHQIRELEYIDDKKICYSLLKSLLKPHKKYLILIFVFSIIYILLSIINTFYFKFIIDNLNKSSNNLYFIFYFFLIVVILKIITDYIRNKWLIYINKNTDEKLMVNTYEHLVFLPYSYFNNRHTGDIISRFNDLNYIRELISHLSITFLVDLILIIFAFFILLSINLYLFLLACLFMVLYIFVVLLFNKPFDRFINASQEKEAVVTSYLVESINAINTIKDLKIENYVIKKIKDKYDSLIQNEYLFGKYYDLEKSLKDLIYLCGITTIIFIGSLFILNHTLTLSNLILFDALLIYFFEPLRNIFDLNTTIKKSFNALKRISELYTKDKEKQSGTLENIDGDIEIKHLSFSYNSIDNILNDINLIIKRGKKIMVTGESGSGKSTLFKLLLRYYDINGCININNKDISLYSIESLRKNLCYVSQNETLFNDSIYENLILGRNISNKNIKLITEITNINSFIKEKNKTLDMILDENGSNLSAGERQRIILARSLLKNANIYIFDECTNQIDSKMERKILENIFKMYNNKTIIVISHRLDNLDLYDSKIEINKGAINNIRNNERSKNGCT